MLRKKRMKENRNSFFIKTKTTIEWGSIVASVLLWIFTFEGFYVMGVTFGVPLCLYYPPKSTFVQRELQRDDLMNIYKANKTSWRIRETIDGKTYSVNVDHRPTQKEAQRLIREKVEERAKVVYNGYPDSYSSFAMKFINAHEKKFSPSTIRGYASILRNTPEHFGIMPVSSITEADVQRVVDEYSVDHSPKSTKQFYLFISSVLRWKNPRKKLYIELPKVEKKFEYEPTTEDIKRILKASAGTEYEVMLRLCALGLRRGEVLALQLSDLTDDDCLSITKGQVTDKDGNLIVRNQPKTEESNRRIAIPHDLAELIRKQGYIYRMYPNSVSRFLHKTQDELGIPRFRLHMFRHFAAAYLHAMGVTDAQVLAYGGWSENSDTMKRVYRYNLDPAKAQKNIVNLFDRLQTDDEKIE